MHERNLKQALTQNVDWSNFEARRSTELLNDPPPSSSPAVVGKKTVKNMAIHCIMRSNPAPTRLSWYFISSQSQCGLNHPSIKKIDCQCPRDKLLATVDTDPQSAKVLPLFTHRARMIRGQEAKQFAASLVGSDPGLDEDTVTVTQLVFNPENPPKLGSYVAWLTNPLGCELCLIQLQKPCKIPAIILTIREKPLCIGKGDLRKHTFRCGLTHTRFYRHPIGNKPRCIAVSYIYIYVYIPCVSKLHCGDK